MPSRPSVSSSRDSLGRRRRRSSKQHKRRRSSSSSSSLSSLSSQSDKSRRRSHASNSRHRDRAFRKRHRRSRSQSPYRRIKRSYSRQRTYKANEHTNPSRKKVDDAPSIAANCAIKKPLTSNKELEILHTNISEEEKLQRLLGISGFDSTKGKSVQDNLSTSATGACRKDTKREYRQYMNRLGGFNRPLDKH